MQSPWAHQSSRMNQSNSYVIQGKTPLIKHKLLRDDNDSLQAKDARNASCSSERKSQSWKDLGQWPV